MNKLILDLGFDTVEQRLDCPCHFPPSPVSFRAECHHLYRLFPVLTLLHLGNASLLPSHILCAMSHNSIDAAEAGFWLFGYG